MQIIRKYNKGIRYLLCAIVLFSKYPWAVPLKDKKGLLLLMHFKKVNTFDKKKTNKIWVDQGSEFYNKSFKKRLKDKDRNKCIQHKMKETLLLLKGLLKLWKIGFTNI